MERTSYNLLTILGPTASGKTGIAAKVACQMNGEIISADSRQVYRGMDIGTGKDYKDYVIDGITIPYHLIDIVDAGFEYNVYKYQNDFLEVYNDIITRKKYPVLCGGSGMYLEAVLKNYKLIRVPVNKKLRGQLSDKSLGELTKVLKSYKDYLHNNTDTETQRRALRAIEIADYYQSNPEVDSVMPEINSFVVGIKFDRFARRERITERLKQRLDDGMLNEVQKLLDSGLTPEQLIYYGLEYKFMTLHLIGEISYEEMFEKLNIAIHQFAKRQMSWFRRMEKQGTKIHWLDGVIPNDEKVKQILQWLKK